MIVFSCVNKQFFPDSYALKDVSFEVHAGDLVLLTGPSGSGKTTIMRLLTKEHTPTSGEIIFQNKNLDEVRNSKIHEHRRKIGVVFQDYKLIPELNIWENIALPLLIIGKAQSEIEERVTDLLELVSLTDKAFHFPKQLSGGEAQRISIARALSTAPAIIFADEPTGNLDKENSIQIARLLTKINQLGTTVLFATHDRDVIELLEIDRHISLENGSLIQNIVKKTQNSTKDTQKESEKVKKEEKIEKSTTQKETIRSDKKQEAAEPETSENSKTTKKEQLAAKPETESKAEVKTDTESQKETQPTVSSTDETNHLNTEQEEKVKNEQQPGFFSRLFGKKKTIENQSETEKPETESKAEVKTETDTEKESQTSVPPTPPANEKVKKEAKQIKKEKKKKDITKS